MLRHVMLSAGFVIATLSFSSIADASDTCARATGGKCPPGQTTPPNKSNPGTVTHKATQAPAKGNHKGRDEYTAEQREKYMESARKLCKAKYGAPSRVYRIDYKRNEVWCEPPGY